MSKQVLLSTRAQKEFKNLSKSMKRRVNESLSKLSEGDTRLDIKKLKGVGDREDLYRLRVGEYMIVYYPERKTIKVIRIDRRDKIYEWLE